MRADRCIRPGADSHQKAFGYLLAQNLRTITRRRRVIIDMGVIVGDLGYRQRFAHVGNNRRAEVLIRRAAP